MNPVQKLEKRLRKEAERALHLALLQAEAIRVQALATSAEIRADALRVAHRISSEIRALASDEALTLLEQTRAEREQMLAEQRSLAAEHRTAAAEQARELLAEAQAEADELLRRAELEATEIRARAREDEERLRAETDAGVAQLRAEAGAALRQVHDEAAREAEALTLAALEQRRLLAEPRDVPESPTALSDPASASPGRTRRVVTALVVVVALCAIGAVVWAVADGADSSSNRTRLASGAKVTPTSSTGQIPGTTPITTDAGAAAPTASVGGSAVTKPARTFDVEAFFQNWTNQSPSLAPSGLATLQQQSLTKPVVEGATGDADSLSDALTRGWVKGYGVFFGSSGTTESSTTATATVYRYGSPAETESAYRATQRAYLSGKADGVTPLGSGRVQAAGNQSFAVRYADNDGQITTAYLEFPGTLVQVSVSSSSHDPEDELDVIVGKIADWAAAAGFA